MSLGLNLYLAKAKRAGDQAQDDPNVRLARPAGKLCWLHVSSAAEIAPVQELLRYLALEQPDVSFLISTPPNAALDEGLQDNFDQPCLAITIPADTPQQVKQFLDHWQPTVAVWVGTALRPALLIEVSSRNIPLYMANARDVGSVDGRKYWNRGMIEILLGLFTHILASRGSVARALVHQGADANVVEICGVLEEGATTHTSDDKTRAEMTHVLASRPVWLAANTNKAEDRLVTKAHLSASRLSHRLLLIIMPDNPARSDKLAKYLADEGRTIARRSLGQKPTEQVQIYIADTEDELELWLRLSPVCFIGNSLTKDAKGLSPFQAAALGSAILHGPNVEKFQAGYTRLEAAGAARLVKNSDELSERVQDLLAPDKAAAMAHAGWDIASSSAEAADRTIELIGAAIDAAEVA